MMYRVGFVSMHVLSCVRDFYTKGYRQKKKLYTYLNYITRQDILEFAAILLANLVHYTGKSRITCSV